MRNVILSADGDCQVYSVPDAVADHLLEYCLKFCKDWLVDSPDAARFRKTFGGVADRYCLCYTEKDFIWWLNAYEFPDEPSQWVANLGTAGDERETWPSEYRDCPDFNF